MFARRVLGLSISCLLVVVGGCANSGLDAISVSPPAQSLAVGQTVQLNATGTFGNGSHSSTQNLTSGVSWASASPSVATVSSSGLATAISVGSATITASSMAFNGPTSASAILTVTSGSGGTGGSGGNILSLTIIPSGIVFRSLPESGQFLAIGTFSTSPTIRDLTNSVTWLTSEPNKFPVTNYSNSVAGTGTQNGGVVSAYSASVGDVGATITAEATDSSGSLAVATAGVGCPLILPTATMPGSCYQNVPQLLSTLTVYNEGVNPNTPQAGGNWLVTAPSATGTAAVLNCGPGAGAGKSVCTATYPLGTKVVLTAPAQTGVNFGGWSSNCTDIGIVTQAGPNTCTINLSTSDATVGGIFN